MRAQVKFPATQPIALQSTTGKPNGLVVFCFIDMVSATNSVKALKETKKQHPVRQNSAPVTFKSSHKKTTAT